MPEFPANVRLAVKDGDVHVLLPGELHTPFERSGYEVRSYLLEAAWRERVLSDEAGIELMARRIYKQTTQLPFGPWEKVPEKYKIGFREEAQTYLQAALEEAMG